MEVGADVAGQPRGRWRRARGLALVLLLTLLAASCTWSREEPGLFPPPATESSAGPVVDERPPVAPTNPRLPVAAEAVWTTGEGVGLQVRFAVHAIRRVAGATVLDWSVTPLGGRGLNRGDSLGFADLGLSRPGESGVDVVLVDPGTGRVYRPLTHTSRQEFNHCLCTPLWVTQLDLRVGETRLLQVAYPSLPAGVGYLDVTLAQQPVVGHVPVTPAGQVPTAREPTDLARPAAPAPALAPAVAFHYPQDRPRLTQSITVERVVAGPGWTSVQWSVRSLTDRPTFSLLPLGLPVSAVPPGTIGTVAESAASGPRLRPAGRDAPVLRAEWMTDRFSGPDRYECRCTTIGRWATSLRQPGGRAIVTTDYPALPPGTTRVDLLLPGVGVVPGLPVVAADDAASRLGPPVPAPTRTWTYSTEEPEPGWLSGEWPTPVPAPDQLRDYRATVDELATPAR